MSEETKQKRRTYYVEYYKRNRDRLLDYQHHYNQSHNPVKTGNQRVGKRFGRLAVTRVNIAKRLEMTALRAAQFKAQLQAQASNNITASSLL
jgi:hypothetical protein